MGLEYYTLVAVHHELYCILDRQDTLQRVPEILVVMLFKDELEFRVRCDKQTVSIVVHNKVLVF